jgi:hypothetical protein
MKAAIMADNKRAGISDSTAKRAMAKAEGKLKTPRPVKVSAKRLCSAFLDWVIILDTQNDAKPSPEVLRLLTESERAEAVAVIEAAIRRYQDLIAMLREAPKEPSKAVH